MNFNKIHELKSNNLFKIFLLISLFLVFKTNKMFGIIVSVFSILYFCSCNSENFGESNANANANANTNNINITVDKAIENVNPDKLKYGHNIDIIRFNELCYQIVKKAKKDRNLFTTIKQKAIKIYGEINKNEKLAEYLKFNNLINNENLPVFITEAEDVYLANEVKIILITMNKNDFENIII
jgi:hypothetical protein